MSKTMIEGIVERGQKSRDANGNKIVKKTMSHGSYRCKRKPASKRCRVSQYLPDYTKKELNRSFFAVWLKISLDNLLK